MARTWLAVDKDGTECIYADKKPLRGKDKWGQIHGTIVMTMLSMISLNSPKAALRNSSEENYLFSMSQSNLKKNSV